MVKCKALMGLAVKQLVVSENVFRTRNERATNIVLCRICWPMTTLLSQLSWQLRTSSRRRSQSHEPLAPVPSDGVHLSNCRCWC